MMQSALDAAGPQAATISHLWWVFFFILMGVFVLVMAGMLVALFRRRIDRDDAPDLAPEHATERTTLKVVVGCVAITTVLLFTFLLMSVISGHAIASFGSPE